MYVGVLTILIAWAVLLAAPLALIGPTAFAAYITRFQIRPEERALSVLFGTEYEDYRSRVRRWL
jgi:protein-S-isoprenylcysteine O-methyltransferase Ste14